MTPKPTPIPRNLKPGDIIVLLNGEQREFYGYTGAGEAVIGGARPSILLPSGLAWADSKYPFAVQIIRKTCKPAKPKPFRHLVSFPTRAKARAAAEAFGGKVQS